MATAERELEVLESIYRNHHRRVRQRDLARVVGLSLGMTNAILKRLAHKGWLVIRKINNRNILYAVTPAGAEEIARRSYRYFKRTIKNVVDYKEAIARVVAAARSRGFRTVALVGASDLDFIVEHVCAKSGVGFVRLASPASHASHAGEAEGAGAEERAARDGSFLLYSERRRRPSGERTTSERGEPEAGCAWLRDILT